MNKETRRGFITTVISAFAALIFVKPKAPTMQFMGPRFYGTIDIPREQRNDDVLGGLDCGPVVFDQSVILVPLFSQELAPFVIRVPVNNLRNRA